MQIIGAIEANYYNTDFILPRKRKFSVGGGKSVLGREVEIGAFW